MLITRCPHCTTTFRVRPEQLNLRGGRVRCGHCHVAFSALNSLEELDDDEAEIVLHSPAPKPAAAPVPPTATAPVSSVPPTPAPPPETPLTHEAMRVAEAAPQQAAVPSYTPTAAFPDNPPSQAPAHSASAAPVPPTPTPLPQAEPPAPVAPPVAPPQPETSVAPLIETAPLPRTAATSFAEPALAPTAAIADAAAPSDHATAPAAPEWEVPDFELELPAEHKPPVPPAAAPREAPVPRPSTPTAAPTPQADYEDIFDIGIDEKPAPSSPAKQPADNWEADEEIALDQPAPGSEPFTELSEPTQLFDDEENDTLTRERLGQQTVFLDEEIKVPAKRAPGKSGWWLACAVLLLAAIAQATFAFRMELARAYPQARPWLEQACISFSCTVPYPRDASAIAVEATDLVPEDGASGRYRLVATLNNRAGYPQAWPNLELTLTDRFDRALSRRVLTPREWLPAQQAQQAAFEARGEITANVGIATDLPAAGYRLYAFYP